MPNVRGTAHFFFDLTIPVLPDPSRERCRELRFDSRAKKNSQLLVSADVAKPADVPVLRLFFRPTTHSYIDYVPKQTILLLPRRRGTPRQQRTVIYNLGDPAAFPNQSSNGKLEFPGLTVEYTGESALLLRAGCELEDEWRGETAFEESDGEPIMWNENVNMLMLRTELDSLPDISQIVDRTGQPVRPEESRGRTVEPLILFRQPETPLKPETPETPETPEPRSPVRRSAEPSTSERTREKRPRAGASVCPNCGHELPAPSTPSLSTTSTSSLSEPSTPPSARGRVLRVRIPIRPRSPKRPIRQKRAAPRSPQSRQTSKAAGGSPRRKSLGSRRSPRRC